MKTLRLGDKTRRLNFRLNEKMADFVNKHSARLGMSPADYMRHLVENAMIADMYLGNK